MVVERRHGTIALKAAIPAKADETEEKSAAEPSLEQLTGQLGELKSESARILRRQLVVGVVGSLCGICFGYVGVTSLIGKEMGIGVTMLLCAGGAFWFVRFVMRDSTTAGETIAKKTKELELQVTEVRHLEDHRMAVTKLGLDRIALELYLKEVMYYPSWIQHSRGRVPARILTATKPTTDAVSLTTSECKYLFEWDHTHMDDGRDRGELTVSANDRSVFKVRAVVSQDQWLTSASAYSVLNFIEGPWVEELLAIWGESKECLQKHRVHGT